MAKILLIDDYYETREIYSDLLTKAGHQVITAADGKEGLDKIIDGGFDLVLVDLLLPKMNATEILEVVKEKQTTKPNKKILIMSVVGQEDLVKKCLELGAAGNIVKSSLSHEEVIKNILSFLDQ